MGDILITATASTGKLNLRKDVRDFTEISDTTDTVGCIFPVVWQQLPRLFRCAFRPKRVGTTPRAGAASRVNILVWGLIHY